MDLITNCEEDLISGLPDSILEKILSLMPTKYAFRTSVLSSSWKYHWASVPILDFDNTSGDCSDLTHLMKFVDRVLRFHGLPFIEKFNLKSGGEFNTFLLDSWIKVLVVRRIKELSVTFHSSEPLFLPFELFTCKTLVVLKLGPKLRLCLPASVYFPELKTLEVSITLAKNNNLTERLFCNCPKLENLIVEGEVLDSGSVNFNISVPELKSLSILFYCFKYCGYSILMKTPKLERLCIQDTYLGHYNPCELPLLQEAHIYVGNALVEAGEDAKVLADQTRLLFEKISQLKSLSLQSCSMKALRGLHHVDGIERPLFPNLTCLRLYVGHCYVRKDLLPFSNYAPNLASLVLIKVPVEDVEDYEHYDSAEDLEDYEHDDNNEDAQDYDGSDEEDNNSDDDDDADYIADLEFDHEYFDDIGEVALWGFPLPCIFSHLREIHMSGLIKSKDELFLINFLLESAVVLERFTINSQEIDIEAARVDFNLNDIEFCSS